ncbi:MAG: hypothetical protein AMS21_06605 [Gemmatimonas sp. SG8_38_2]|nr:MAG: hypothetical protein AMS21_06605 [Gemmatimonas sp. SG8_38_2]
MCAVLLSACASDTDSNTDTSSTDDGYRGRLLQPPREKVDFSLQDTQGATFEFRERTDGFVTLLFFGYTHCPDVCPIHMANIAAVLKDFSYELRQQFKVIFVTTDPQRDTPQRMRQWLDNFDPAFIGLWGDHDEVNEIAGSLGLPPSVIFESEDGEYAVGHSAHVMVFTKDNLSHILYPFGTRQADWAHDLPGLANETWGE